MFGLSLREKLSKIILNASKNEVFGYIKNTKESLNNITKVYNEEDYDNVVAEIRRDYLNSVAYSVFNMFMLSAPTIYARINLCLSSPSICGYDIDSEFGFSAGSVYAICYYAFSNRKAMPKDCIILNHLQYDIMEEALGTLGE